MPTLLNVNAIRDGRNISEIPPRVIITREGTELADRLRATGWVVRAGWRTTQQGQSVWHLRFEVAAGTLSHF